MASVIVALGAGGGATAAGAALLGGSGGFARVAVHPQAALQPTVAGRTITTLKPWNGSLYSGYGDYGANTGPVAITPFSGSAFGVPELIADTEAVGIYRELGGSLYAPSLDPRVSSDFAQGSLASGLLNWINPDPLGSSHAFDMASLDGGDLWLVGSQGAEAVAWQSLDGGSTWTEMLRVPPTGVANGDFTRFYGAATYAGRLYLQATDYYAGPHPRSLVFDGTGWSEGPSLPTFTHADTFDGRMLFHATYHSGRSPAALMSFDGQTAATVLPSVYDYTVAGGAVYVLDTQRKVKLSYDLVTWTQLGTAPPAARSIGVLDGVIYLGGANAVIYRQR